MQREKCAATVHPCLVLYGDSVFLSGIQAELVRDRELGLDLISLEAGCPDVIPLLRQRKPCAVLFDLTLDQPGFFISILRQHPGLLMIGLDPSSDEMLVLSAHPVQALAIRDLVHLLLEASKLQEGNSQGKQTGGNL